MTHHKHSRTNCRWTHKAAGANEIHSLQGSNRSLKKTNGIVNTSQFISIIHLFIHSFMYFLFPCFNFLFLPVCSFFIFKISSPPSLSSISEHTSLFFLFCFVLCVCPVWVTVLVSISSFSSSSQSLCVHIRSGLHSHRSCCITIRMFSRPWLLCVVHVSLHVPVCDCSLSQLW